MRRVLFIFSRRPGTLGLALAVLCIAQPSRAAGQQSLTCAQAQNILLDPSSTRVDLYGAMAKMVRCGDSAPGAIGTMLRSVSLASTADTVARTGAWALLDKRLVDSVRVLALDQSQPTGRRLFCLRLLARYAALNAVVDDTRMNEEAPSVLQAVSDPGGVDGTIPLTAESHTRARATIQTMAMQDPDSTIRKLAGLVYAELRFYMQ